VDTTAPGTTVDSGPGDPTNATGASFDFSSSEAGSSFECSLDGSLFVTCSSSAVYSSLTEGAHTFEVKATDAVGNTDPTPASYGWTVDTSAPDTTIDSGPADPTTETGATFGFSSSETGSTFECSLDGSPFASCSSPNVQTALEAGSHTFEVRATDPAGNTDQSPASHAWTIT
jgi:large repetitive protein